MPQSMKSLIRQVRWARRAVVRAHGPIRIVRVERVTSESLFAYDVTFFLRDSEMAVVVSL